MPNQTDSSNSIVYQNERYSNNSFAGSNSSATILPQKEYRCTTKQIDGQAFKQHPISETHLAEWLASGVHQDLIAANVYSLTDSEMIAESLNISNTAKAIYKNTVLNGGWVCTGYTGVQFKADKPRTDKKKNKLIKYESAKGISSRYSLLNIPDELFVAICNKHGVDAATKPKAENAWAFFLRHPEIPIAVVEGVKKAGCWMSQLFMPAIALHGHTMLNIFDKTESAISAFYHPKRQLFLCLDNDPIYTAKKAVDLTITKFKSNLEASRKVIEVTAKNNEQLEREVEQIAEEHSIAVSLLTIAKKKQRKTKYDVIFPIPVQVSFVSLPEEAKGCDDLWALQGVEGLEKVLQKAKPIGRFIETYRHCLGHKPNVEFSSTKWEVPVPEEERSVVLIGAKGGGKTWAMRQVMIKAKNANEPIAYLSPRRSLNRQTAESMGLVFVDAQEIIESHQIALCPQSLHKVPVDKFKDCVLIWDETTQCLQELLLSSTTNKNRETLLTNLVLILGNAKQIICADADFDYNNINLLKGLIGVEPYIMRNKLAANKYTAYITKGTRIDGGVHVAGDLIKIAEEFLKDGKRLAIYTGSQEAEYKFSSTTLGLHFQGLGYTPSVIDSATIRDPESQSYQCMKSMRDFYALAEKTNPTLYTQSLGTGFSIEKPKLYDAVFGIFSGVGTPDAARQAIMRYRELVPRYLWIAERGKNDDLGYLGIYPDQVKTTLSRKLEYTRKAVEKIDSILINENPEIKVNQLLDNYVNEIVANNNYYNAHYYEAAIQGLEKDGAEIVDITEKIPSEISDSYAIYKMLKGLADENKAQIQEEIIQAEVLSDEEFEDLSRSNTIRRSEQRNLDKTALSKRYGVEVTEELIQKDKDGWYKQLKNHYSATVGYDVISARAQINYLRGAQRNFGELFDYTRKQNNVVVAELIRGTELLEELLKNPVEHETSKLQLPSGVDVVLSHKIVINKEDEYSQKLYQKLVDNIEKLNDCFGLKIRKQSFDPKKFDFKLIKYLLAQLGFMSTQEGASSNRKYTIGVPDDGRNEVFQYWLEKEQSYIEKQNNWRREREVQKLKQQLKPTIAVAEFQELQNSEYFDDAWELIPVYERTLILNRVDGFEVPECKTAFLNPDDVNFEKYLADIKTWDAVSLDLETYGLDKKNKNGLHYRKGRIRFIQISNGIRAYIADCGHRDVENQTTNWKVQTPVLTPFFKILNEKLTNPAVKIVGQNIHFDLRFLRINGFDTATNVQDTLKGIKIFLGDSGNTGVLNGGYGLGNLVLKLLGLSISKEEQKSDWGRVDITESQITYAANDPHLTFYVYQTLEKWYTNPAKYGFKKLIQPELRAAWQLENDVIPAAVDMELTGIPIDREAATKLLAEYKELQALLLSDWTGLVPDIAYAQTQKLKQHLISKYDRQIPKLNKETLAELTDLDEVKVLQKLRAVKVPIQQLEVFLRSSEATGRIQTVFNTLTGTGRFSSGMSKQFDDLPNLQSVSEKPLQALEAYKKVGVRSVVRQNNKQRGFAVIDLAGAHGRIAADVANDINAIAGNNDDSVDNHSKVAVYVAHALGVEIDWKTIKEAAKDKKHLLHKKCKMFRATAKGTFYGWLNGAGAKRIQADMKAKAGLIVELEACQAAIKGCEILYPQVVEFRKELMKYMASEEALITIDGEVYTINKIQMVNNRILHKTAIVNEQVSLPYTQILAAIWSRTEASALKRAFVKIQDVIKQNPEWELKVINYVHDEMNFEFNINFAEVVITTVRDVIGDEFQKCLRYVKDGREPDWRNLLVNSWADK